LQQPTCRATLDSSIVSREPPLATRQDTQPASQEPRQPLEQGVTVFGPAVSKQQPCRGAKHLNAFRRSHPCSADCPVPAVRETQSGNGVGRVPPLIRAKASNDFSQNSRSVQGWQGKGWWKGGPVWRPCPESNAGTLATRELAKGMPAERWCPCLLCSRITSSMLATRVGPIRTSTGCFENRGQFGL
jgi:hypothetical protein